MPESQAQAGNEASYVRENAGQSRMNIKIDGEFIDPQNMLLLITREWILDNSPIPKLELKIMDDGTFFDYKVPYQGKLISVDVCRDGTEEFTPTPNNSIYGEYIIVDFEYSKSPTNEQGDPSEINITAVLNLPEYFQKLPTQAFEEQDSVAVLNAMADLIKCEFNTNVTSAADSMNWLAINQTHSQFINHVARRSYLGSNDATFCFITTDKLLNYFSLKTGMTQPNKIKAKYDARMATAMDSREMIEASKEFKIEESEVLATLWYTQWNMKNASNSSELLNNGFKNEILFSDINTVVEGYENKLDPADPQLEITVVEVDASTELLTADEDPHENSLQTDKTLYNGVLYNNRTPGENVYSDEYYSSKTVRKNMIAAIVGNSTIIEVNPNTEIKIGDLLEVEVPSQMNLEQDQKVDTINGDYIILGMIQVVENSFYKKLLSIHKIGFNEQNVV